MGNQERVKSYSSKRRCSHHNDRDPQRRACAVRFATRSDLRVYARWFYYQNNTVIVLCHNSVKMLGRALYCTIDGYCNIEVNKSAHLKMATSASGTVCHLNTIPINNTGMTTQENTRSISITYLRIIHASEVLNWSIVEQLFHWLTTVKILTWKHLHRICLTQWPKRAHTV